MQMLMIIMKESLEDDVRMVLRKNKVTAFTEMHEATGQGEAGATLHSLSWPGFNNVIFVALPEPEASKLIESLVEFRDQQIERQSGAPIPLRVFSMPCELVV